MGDGGGSDELAADSIDVAVELSGGSGGGIPAAMPAWSR